MASAGLVIGLILAAYLLGSIPFALLIGFAHGVDVRQHGSGNIGATNVGRVVGKKWGYLCLVLDVLKGLIPTAVSGHFLVRTFPTDQALVYWLLTGLAAVLGHVFPVYLGFRGGKGVATTIGVSLGIFPHFTIPILLAVAGYAAVRFTTGIVALGSLTMAVLFPVCLHVYLARQGLLLASHWPLVLVAWLLALLIIVRHASNIRNLLSRSTRHREGPDATTTLRPDADSPSSTS